jgi:hypothetical protein
VKSLDGKFLTDPKEGSGFRADLIDQQEVPIAFGILNFIDANGANVCQRAMLQAPVDHFEDCIADPIPSGVERHCGFLSKTACVVSE